MGGAATGYTGYMYPTFSVRPPWGYKGCIDLDSSAGLQALIIIVHAQIVIIIMFFILKKVDMIVQIKFRNVQS